MLFFLAFGLTQNIANAANNSSNSNIDLLDCNHDEKVRLFLDPIFCIKPGYKEKTKSGYKERAEIVSDRLAYFVRSEISPEYLILNPCENNLTTCFDLSYKEPKSNKDINIISIQKEDIEYLLPEQYNNQNQDIDLETQIKTTILPRIKEAVKNFRESQCQLTTQAVTIELNEVTQTLFCIKTSIRDDENISERAKRVTEKIKNIQAGKIHVETLEIVKVSDLKEKFGIAEFENLTDGNKEENSVEKESTDDKLPNFQSLAIVSHQKNLSQDDRIIFILTKLDLELINSKHNKSYTTVQAIDNYYQKIVTFVTKSDKSSQGKQPKSVYFNWGLYNNFIFRRLNSLKEQQTIESQEDLFKVHNKAGFYNPSYRAVTIGNKISTLANDRWRIFWNPKLGVYYKKEKENVVTYYKLCQAKRGEEKKVTEEEEPNLKGKVKEKNVVTYYKLCQAKGGEEKKVNEEEELNKNTVIIRNSNIDEDSKEDLNLNIMTISNDDQDKPHKEEEYAFMAVLPKIKQAIYMYRYNQWLVLEIIFLSVTSAVYFFHLDKTK